MKNHASKSPPFGVALIAMAAAITLVVALEVSVPSSPGGAKTARGDGEDPVARTRATSSLEGVARAAAGGASARYAYRNSSDWQTAVDTVLPEKHEDEQTQEKNQAALTELDSASLLASNDNVNAEPAGDYADQINQATIVAKAISEGHLLLGIPRDGDSPGAANVTSEPRGEHAQEVNQRVLIEKGKAEGYLASGGAVDSLAATAANVASGPRGEHANEIDQRAIVEKARSEGYVIF